MILDSLIRIVTELNTAGARYLIAEGLAVNAHGYTRATHDIDLVIQLDRANLEPALHALAGLGYRPLAPVPMMAFADPSQRARWIEEKGLTVFAVTSDLHPQAPIDIFVREPFAFDVEYERALAADLVPGSEVTARFVGLDTLIDMKRAVGRHRDLDDVEHLELIRDQLRGTDLSDEAQ